MDVNHPLKFEMIELQKYDVHSSDMSRNTTFCGSYCVFLSIFLI